MVELWRCEICGDLYIGEAPPENCPFCGAHEKYIKKAKDANVDFNVELTEKDRKNVEKALYVELSNASFYFCAAEKTDDPEGKMLFKALGKVESEHASIWKKILKPETVDSVKETCSIANIDNLKESHDRETSAIEFYRQAEEESDNERIKEIFKALVEIEEDHLKLSEVRMN